MILKSTFLLLSLSFSSTGWTKLSIVGKTEVKKTKPYKIIIVTDPTAFPRAEK